MNETYTINKLYFSIKPAYSQLRLSFIKMPIQQMNSYESSEYSICLINSNMSDSSEQSVKLNS